MKRALSCLLLLLLLLTGCGAQRDSYDAQAAQARVAYLAMQRCAGSVDLHVDYGERVYDYTIDFTQESEGETVLVLRAPEALAGITARIAEGETLLSFDGAQLETGALSEEGLTPLAGIPRVLAALRGGYIAETGGESLDGMPTLRLQLREPEMAAGEGVETVIHLQADTMSLLYAELFQDGFCQLRLKFTDFTKE